VPDLGDGIMRFLQCQMRVTCGRVALLIGLRLFSTAVTRAIAIDNVVLQWNEAIEGKRCSSVLMGKPSWSSARLGAWSLAYCCWWILRC